ncbi:MAG: sel1 repeat family protein [Candidatus Coatesbacteria bacterium]|nr:sel1 repeat family protein [Candidatus Coatesbacteria bacterium]
MYFLGWMCYYGRCAEQDYEKAVEWFRKAAAASDKDGMYYLGVAYENGKGLEKDRDKAIEWYRKALSYGHDEGGKALKRLEAEYEESGQN